jgi:Protein of unknown function (DUF5131)
MSDLFHEAVPAKFVAAVWDAMQATPQHTYQILTKRPDQMAKITASLPVLPNVWLGTSVERAPTIGAWLPSGSNSHRSKPCETRSPSSSSRTRSRFSPSRPIR